MPTPLIDALIEATGDTARVSALALDRHAAAHDASHFLLTPQVVVTARNAAEVGRLFAVSARHRVPLTLRSGGTSLSGQAVTDGILVDVRKSFRTTQVLDDGARIRTQPGVTVLRLNAELARYGRKIGPDPASESACTIGGVVANNSSGMACGTVENTYRTLDSMVVVLPSGTVVDTGAPDADARLRHDEPEIFAGLLRLRDRVRANPASVAKIRQQFAMKNTMGYGLNALLDFDDPCQILAHLIVGSEGTLGFVAEVTLRTVALRGHASSALLVFDDLGAANRALPDLVGTGAATLELMDDVSLRVGQRLPDAPAQIATLEVTGQAALLLEYQSTDRDELASLTEAAAPVLAGLPLQHPAELTDDPAVRGRLWKLRKGLYASVAGARASGTTALLEDVVVPVKLLADTCAGLHELFNRYRYRDSVIFGHAKDGNIHFLITDRFADDEPLRRYADFHRGHGRSGSGAGRFTEGRTRDRPRDGALRAAAVRRRTLRRDGGNQAADRPGRVAEPGRAARRRTRRAPAAHQGHPDRRGGGRPVRGMRVLRAGVPQPRSDADPPAADRAAARNGHRGISRRPRSWPTSWRSPTTIPASRPAPWTACAARRARCRSTPAIWCAGCAGRTTAGWPSEAGRWPPGTGAPPAGRRAAALTAAAAVPAVLPATASRAGRAVAGTDTVPLWSADLPRGGRPRRRPAPVGEPDAVYLPACVNAMFGPAGDGRRRAGQCRKAVRAGRSHRS